MYDKRDAGREPPTLGLLSGLFTFAIEEEVIDNNQVKVPAKRLRKAYPPPQKTKYLSPYLN